MARKVKVDLDALADQMARQNHAQRHAAIKAGELARRTKGSMAERMKLSGVLSLDDIEDLLEYEYDEKGKKISKISEGTRAKYNLLLFQHHPDMIKAKTPTIPQPVFNVQLDNKTLLVAKAAQTEIDLKPLKMIPKKESA